MEEADAYYTDEEEETDDEYDNQMYGMHQALPIPDGEPDWDAGEPDTAEEYLRRVRWEAARVPQVVTSDIDASKFTTRQTSYIPALGVIPDAAVWAQIDHSWAKRFVLEFQQLRRYLAELSESQQLVASTQALPHQNDHQGWDRLCFGKEMQTPSVQQRHDSDQDASSSDAMATEDPGEFSVPGPMMHIITRLDQVGVVLLLLRHVDQLDNTGLTLLRSQWLFALTARLDKPVHAETAAALRQLFRRCCHIRAQLQQHDDPSLPLLNIMITISGGYFGQDEQLTRIIDLDLY